MARRFLVLTWFGLIGQTLKIAGDTLTNTMVLQGPSNHNSALMGVLSLLAMATTAVFWLGYGILIGKDRPLLKSSALLSGVLVVVSPVIFHLLNSATTSGFFENQVVFQNILNVIRLVSIAAFLWVFALRGSLPLRITAGMYMLWLFIRQVFFQMVDLNGMWLSTGANALLTLPFYIALILHQSRIARPEPAREHPS